MRRFFAPEIVQTSALDCGPAALQSLLSGFRLPSSYGRLREACQTGLDGTSIDTIEAVASARGLEAEQLILPADHVFLPESKSLPAIVVVTLADGLSHFVVVWRRHGSYLQVMDPSVGRRWVRAVDFQRELYSHRLTVPAEAWREFAGSDEFCRTLARRLRALNLSSAEAAEALRRAKTDAGWRGLATLDAACRALTAVRQSAKAGNLHVRSSRALQALCEQPEAIPEQFWSARSEDEGDSLRMRGAVLVRALRRKTQSEEGGPQLFAPELEGALPASAFCQVVGYLRKNGLLTPVYLGLTVAGVAGGLFVEALLFRGLFDFSSQLKLPGQRLSAMGALLMFAGVVSLLDLLSFAGATRICRRLEMAFRSAFLAKVPRLPDRYFQSRLQSDMGERSHALHRLRYLPDIVRRLLASIFELLATAAGIVWLEPSTAPFVVCAVLAALTPACLSRSFLNESDLRVRTHAAALTRFYLDAALGLTSIRVHGAEDNLRRAHGSRLKEWMRAALRLQRGVVTVESVQTTAMFASIAMLFLVHPLSGANVGRLLLVAYWALNLPTAGQNIGILLRQLPGYRSLVLRVCELAETAEEKQCSPAVLTDAPSIRFSGVAAEASGHSILNGVDLDLTSGAHVAIVGPSGAGKSSLIGLLLGWLAPSQGQILIGGSPLNAVQLRRSAAWLDPSVQLWNKTLFDNVTFGATAGSGEAGAAADAAHLRPVLQDLPEGLQTMLGEGGARLSGGEGQRVRLARTILRTDAPLVLLDEPFRGLDRELRAQLLVEARHRWSSSTLLCVTHDLRETRNFDRILVVEGGRVVEQGTPAELLQSEFSRYRTMMEAEEALQNGLWQSRHWRRLHMHGGHLTEEHSPRHSLQTVRASEEVA